MLPEIEELRVFGNSSNRLKNTRFTYWAMRDLNQNSQVSPDKELNKTPQKQEVQNTVHHKQFTPDLQEIIDRWEKLPEHLKETIRMLVEAAKKNP
jgi:hypothetical protein